MSSRYNNLGLFLFNQIGAWCCTPENNFLGVLPSVAAKCGDFIRRTIITQTFTKTSREETLGGETRCLIYLAKGTLILIND